MDRSLEGKRLGVRRGVCLCLKVGHTVSETRGMGGRGQLSRSEDGSGMGKRGRL